MKNSYLVVDSTRLRAVDTISSIWLSQMRSKRRFAKTYIVGGMKDSDLAVELPAMLGPLYIVPEDMRFKEKLEEMRTFDANAHVQAVLHPELLEYQKSLGEDANTTFVSAQDILRDQYPAGAVEVLNQGSRLLYDCAKEWIPIGYFESAFRYGYGDDAYYYLDVSDEWELASYLRRTVTLKEYGFQSRFTTLRLNRSIRRLIQRAKHPARGRRRDTSRWG